MKSLLHICLPVLDEFMNLSNLIGNLQNQSYKYFKLFVCVNQPDAWWHDEVLKEKCIDNAKSLEYLSQDYGFEIVIIDKSSQGKGWKGKKRGVGWARKLVMDLASEVGNPSDLIVSVDADTFYPEDYFQSLVNLFAQNSHIAGHSNPYYHPLKGKNEEDYAILRYELYMRIFAINMLMINNPYAFTAIGSGMACTVFQYNRVGGISPKLSGEDFYFIQKLSKSGEINNYNEVKIFPQARFSDRVFFGTGPAMIKGNSGDWSSYPFYSPNLFQKIADTFMSFEELFRADFETPMTTFLKMQLKREDLWGTLRKNFKTKEHFVKACTELVDGLRILQFLKESHQGNSEAEDFMENIEYLMAKDFEFKEKMQNFKLGNSPFKIENMIFYREELTNLEYKLRKLKSIH